MRKFALGLIIVAACATSGTSGRDTQRKDRILGVDAQTSEVMHTQSSDGPVSATLHASTDAVWKALPAAYAGLGIDLMVIDRPSGTIGNRSFIRTRTLAGKRLSAYFECGSSMTGLRADEGRVTAASVTRVTAASDGETQLSTTVAGVVQTVEGSSAQSIPCASTGALEEAIRNAVARQLSGM